MLGKFLPVALLVGSGVAVGLTVELQTSPAYASCSGDQARVTQLRREIDRLQDTAATEASMHPDLSGQHSHLADIKQEEVDSLVKHMDRSACASCPNDEDRVDQLRKQIDKLRETAATEASMHPDMSGQHSHLADIKDGEVDSILTHMEMRRCT